MGLLESLPARPLTRAELAKLNGADAVDLVAPVTEGDDADADTAPNAEVEGVLVATDAWVQAVVFRGDAWDAVARVNLDDTERFGALRACEAEALDVLSRRASDGGAAAVDADVDDA